MSELDTTQWQAMNEIIPNLWVGDLSAALAADLLDAHNIKFVISAMRGRVKINPVGPEL
jgi:dual specificity phosphatase 12